MCYFGNKLSDFGGERGKDGELQKAVSMVPLGHTNLVTIYGSNQNFMLYVCPHKNNVMNND